MQSEFSGWGLSSSQAGTSNDTNTCLLRKGSLLRKAPASDHKLLRSSRLSTREEQLASVMDKFLLPGAWETDTDII